MNNYVDPCAFLRMGEIVEKYRERAERAELAYRRRNAECIVLRKKLQAIERALERPVDVIVKGRQDLGTRIGARLCILHVRRCMKGSEL